MLSVDVISILANNTYSEINQRDNYISFQHVKDVYQGNNQEQVFPVKTEAYKLIFLCGIALFIIGYYLKVSILFPIIVIVGAIEHFNLISLLVHLANTNYAWYNFFSNPLVTKLFGVARCEEGVVCNMGGWFVLLGQAPAFLILYILEGFLVVYLWCFFKKKRRLFFEERIEERIKKLANKD